ncbi:MAG: hypothetical protein NVSMB23_21520 [Myxococcales bacterium]
MDTALLIEPAPAIARDLPAAASSSRELQRLWFSLAARPWSALLIVPAPGATGGVSLASALLQVSRRAGLDPRISLIDATRASLEQASNLLNQLSARVGQGERVLVAIDPIDESPAALPLVARCDAALLCLALGRSALEPARRTIDLCGRTRFLGSVVWDAAGVR